MDRLSDYDYDLPEELIAQQPLVKRDASRMLVVERQAERTSSRMVRDLPEYVRAGDCLVLNDTKVLPARLRGVREATGGRWSGLYVGTTTDGDWELLSKTRGKLRPGETLLLTPRDEGDKSATPVRLRLVEKTTTGGWIATPEADGPPEVLLATVGEMPLPPYIERQASRDADFERYQTVFAENAGAIAAPTAGLHFTPELLAEIEAQGVRIARVTLHVGIGTFRPVSEDDLTRHVMHHEWCALSEDAADAVNRTKAEGGRIFAVGTTSVRTLESAARLTDGPDVVRPFQGETDLFIRPPYKFGVVDALLTNFHLPKSTLLMLVSALASRELIFRAYAEAIEERYRFFSYGDAMLIV